VGEGAVDLCELAQHAVEGGPSAPRPPSTLGGGELLDEGGGGGSDSLMRIGMAGQREKLGHRGRQCGRGLAGGEQRKSRGDLRFAMEA